MPGALSPARLLPLPALLGLFIARPAAALSISDARCTQQADNALRFDCVVEVDEPAAVSLRFCDATAEGTGCLQARNSERATAVASTTCSGPGACYVADLTVWNLISGHDYEWSAVAATGPLRVGFTADAPDDVFTAGALPSPDLALMELSVSAPSPGASRVRYVGFDFGCKSSGGGPGGGEVAYFVVADADGNIVWYQDPRQQTGRSSSQLEGVNISRFDKHILLIDSEETVLEYDLAGRVYGQIELADGDFTDVDGLDRYPHHDLQRVGDHTYVLVAGEYNYIDVNDCDADGRTDDRLTYVLDGVYDYDADWVLQGDHQWSLGDIYSPDDCIGPQPPDCRGTIGGSSTACDWFHGNSLEIGRSGDWLLSSRVQDRVIQVDGTTGDLLWELVGDNDSTGEGDWSIDIAGSVGSTHFDKQHHVRSAGRNRLRMFDNHDDDATPVPRGVEVQLDPFSRSFAIVDEWPVAGDLACETTGSLYDLPLSDHVLLTCGPGESIQEFDGDGAVVWQLDLSCPTGTPAAVTYRGVPMDLDP